MRDRQPLPDACGVSVTASVHQPSGRAEQEDLIPAMADRPRMLSAEFEQLARHSGETVTLEFLYGKLGVKAVPDGDHAEIIRWIARQILPLRGELWLYQEVDIKVDKYRNGRARADGVLAPDGSFAGQGCWVDPDPAVMVVEVTSYDSDIDRRDRVEKPRAYAEATSRYTC
ncbi:Uma2 family endonuclease [Nocardia sp. NPDC052112]|uniref:Uma2 family endonuclease n=1 Tax=Nocardia sp. NPDC052112 TaxID=3155646 RepID=UPI0034163644